ncbi:MAG TPA: CU044_2847 family protein [Stenomitos sp.]
MAIIKSSETVNGEEVEIYIEADQVPAKSNDEDWGEVRSTRVMSVVPNLFGDGLRLARNCAARVVENVNQMSTEIKPEEFEVQLAIKLDSEVGAVLAKATTGAQMQITMKWNLKKPS